MGDDQSFVTHVAGIVKQFVNQKNDKYVTNEPWILNSSTKEDFLDNIWLEIESHIKREIVVDADKPSWAEQVRPQYTELAKFVMFFDTISRSSYEADHIDESLLERWNDGRLVKVYIYPYSNALRYKKMFEAVEKTLFRTGETDRAGAAAETELNQLVEELQSIHERHYQSAMINWKVWADFIFKQPAHIRQTLVSKPPPGHIIHLFANARTPADEVLQDVRQNLSIANGINVGIDIEVASLRTHFDMIKRHHLSLEQAISDFETRLVSLEQKLKNNMENITLFQSATNVEENEYGSQLFDYVGEQDDVDHS